MNKGFTLIELLVVIAIIGFTFHFGGRGFGSCSSKARGNAKRLSRP